MYNYNWNVKEQRYTWIIKKPLTLQKIKDIKITNITKGRPQRIYNWELHNNHLIPYLVPTPSCYLVIIFYSYSLNSQ